MAGSLTNYQAKLMLDALFGSGTPATLYLAAFTTVPTEAGGGTEATGGNYARLAITNNSTNFPAAGGTTLATKTFGTQQEWPAATANLGNIVGIAIMDAASGGNMRAYSDIASTPVNIGSFLRVPAGQQFITLD